MSELYFERYGWPVQYSIPDPDPELGLIIVIPSYKENLLFDTLESLNNCIPPSKPVEVLVVINEKMDESPDITELHKSTLSELRVWRFRCSNVKLYTIYANQLSKKDFGVGLARKIGMDEAAKRFFTINNPKGLIVCLDADCTVEPNYLKELNKFYVQSNSPGCSIYYEHTMNNPAIIEYELHLRYFIHAQRMAGFTNAFQTVGSSMAVRADAYTKQGGMNKRKAGEDFYFIHKIISLGNFQEIKTTTVHPSDRVSDRVPFGTGRAMQNEGTITTYNPQSFIDLKYFLDHKESLFEDQMMTKDMPESIKEFFSSNKLMDKISKLAINSRDKESFSKRFFHVFDAFQVIKYLHFARDNYYPNLEVSKAADWLLRENFNLEPPSSMKGKLAAYREVDLT